MKKLSYLATGVALLAKAAKADAVSGSTRVSRGRWNN